MRQTFADTLHEIMSQDDQVIILNADTGAIVLDQIKDDFPDRCINVGIAEQNMIGLAAGLALSGKIVYCYALLPFVTMRCYEQIRIDACCINLPIKLVGIGAGLDYNTLGPTHHGLEDIALMRALPNMTIFSPADRVATKALTYQSYMEPGPFYLRLDRYGRDLYHWAQSFEETGFNVMDVGSNLCLIATGEKVEVALKVVEKLWETEIEAGVIDVYRIKPLPDMETLCDIVSNFGSNVIILEEHSIIGGLGDALLAAFIMEGHNFWVRKLGLPDKFCRKYGSREYLQSLVELDIDSIVQKIRGWFTIGGTRMVDN